MSGARTLKNWISRHQAPEPVKRDDAQGALALQVVPPAQRIAQLNLKVPPSVKHQFRLLAAHEGISMVELFYRMLRDYEDRHGRSS